MRHICWQHTTVTDVMFSALLVRQATIIKATLDSTANGETHMKREINGERCKLSHTTAAFSSSLWFMRCDLVANGDHLNAIAAGSNV